MKKILSFFVLLPVVWACSNETDLQSQIDGLDGRLSSLEEKVESLNSELSSLYDLISGKRFITGVTENEDGSHTIEMVSSDGIASSVTVRDGADGYSPQIGVRQDSDGVYCWTLDGEFILDGEGNRLPVSGNDGVTPEFKIEEGKWFVSYDGGGTWIECGDAQADADPALIKDVTVSEDGKIVYITLHDDTVLAFDVHDMFGISLDPAEDYISPGGSIEVRFALSGADSSAVVEAIAGNGWMAETETDETGVSGVITVTAPESGSTGKVVVLANDGGYRTVMKTLTFVTGELNISTSSAEAPASGGPVSVEVETDMDYDIVIPEEAGDWISIVGTRAEMRTDTLTFNVAANAGAMRQAEIRLQTGGGSVLETILIWQLADYDDDALVFSVKASEYTGSGASYSNMVYLPLRGEVNVTVDWGDGNVEEVSRTVSGANTYINHTYSSSGVYYVSVSGSAEQINGQPVNRNVAGAITGVIQWGRLGVTSLSYAFNNNTSLVSVPSPDPEAFRNVTSASRMFYGCSSLTSVPEDLLSSAAGLDDVSSMFSGCSSIETVPGNMFASNPAVTAASSLFADCSSLKSVPDGILSNMPALENVSGIFNGCVSLTEVPADLFASNPEITNMSSAFTECSSIRSFPAGLLRNQSKVTNVGTMFAECSALETVPEGFLDALTEVTNMPNLFRNCSSLRSLPSGIFDRLSKVTSVSSMFQGCTSLSEFPSLKGLTSLVNVSSLWRDCTQITSVPSDYFPESVSRGTTVANMFANCTSLKTVPEDFFENFTGVTIISSLFSGCTSLESLPAGVFDSMRSIRTAAGTFEDCSAFTGESPYTLVDGKKVHLYERSADNGFTAITSFRDCFAGCTLMADYTMIPQDWGGVSDGTSDVPVLEASMTPAEGAEYYCLDVAISGTDVRECRYVLAEKATIEARVEEMGGYEPVCNRYGTAMGGSVIDMINSDAGYSVQSSDDLESDTDYMLVVMATNVHGRTIVTAESRTGSIPEGEAAYERYVGTWTVTSASSEISGQPQEFTVEIEPYRTNESFRVSGWGITTIGNRDVAPFIMTYDNGNVSVSTFDYYGMVGMYYAYLKYRFYNPEQEQYLVWTTKNVLCHGSFGEDGSIVLECDSFTDPDNGVEYSVSGMDYFLYSGGNYYESRDLFKPEYIVSDYSIAPYRLVRASSAASVPLSERAGEEFILLGARTVTSPVQMTGASAASAR